jgi:cytidylate kinase
MAKTYIKFLEPFEKELVKKIKKKGLTITVSGFASSGKSTGAKAIAKAFKLKYVFAGKFFREIAKERSIPLEKFSEIREDEIDYESDRRTLELAMKGDVVLDARLSGFVAGDWADVRIFYECPLGVRARRAAARDNLSFEEAVKAVERRDIEDKKRYKKLYDIDSCDKSIYDIIIDNEKLTLEENKTVPVKLVKNFLEKEG